MSTNWAYQFCPFCNVRLAAPGELCCDRCEYDMDMAAAQIEDDDAR